MIARVRRASKIQAYLATSRASYRQRGEGVRHCAMNMPPQSPRSACAAATPALPQCARCHSARAVWCIHQARGHAPDSDRDADALFVFPQLLWLHVQEVEYVKQEAKIVYLLECLQARLAQYTLWLNRMRLLEALDAME